MQSTHLLSAFVCAAFLASCRQEDPQLEVKGNPPEIVNGPIRSSKEINGFILKGLHLGMPLEVAQRKLEEQGFAQRTADNQPISDTTGRNLGHVADYWGMQPIDQQDRQSETKCSPPIGNLVHLGYVKLKGRRPLIASITYSAPVTCEDLKRVEDKRKQIISHFGLPTYWRKEAYVSGFIGDKISYVSTAKLADEVEYGKISSCLINWQQQKLCYNIDCRKVLNEASGVMMQVGYYGWETYQLQDITAQRASLMRDPLFLDQFVAGKTCIPSYDE